MQTKKQTANNLHSTNIVATALGGEGGGGSHREPTNSLPGHRLACLLPGSGGNLRLPERLRPIKANSRS